MRAIITIEMDGAAFDYLPGRELYLVLKEAVVAYTTGRARAIGENATLRDSNGNACGTFEIVE